MGEMRLKIGVMGGLEVTFRHLSSIVPRSLVRPLLIRDVSSLPVPAPVCLLRRRGEHRVAGERTLESHLD